MRPPVRPPIFVPQSKGFSSGDLDGLALRLGSGRLRGGGTRDRAREPPPRLGRHRPPDRLPDSSAPPAAAIVTSITWPAYCPSLLCRRAVQRRVQGGSSSW